MSKTYSVCLDDDIDIKRWDIAAIRKSIIETGVKIFRDATPSVQLQMLADDEAEIRSPDYPFPNEAQSQLKIIEELRQAANEQQRLLDLP